ncbi:Unc-89 [Cordylochernes scorpioides]|uniref:Unc-89 n=1 Tax=Cordylochernes scorpioides TaxID=51811 RepID=A0ABY6L1U8_9ARAC|nr:Unc-89 [Cordylochernes scorpioides]
MTDAGRKIQWLELKGRRLLEIAGYGRLTGHSPFLGTTDRDTLANVQKGKFDPYYDGFLALSDEARDFITKLLVFDPSGRMDVTTALSHPWLKLADSPEKCEKLEHMDKLRDYSKHWRNWVLDGQAKTAVQSRLPFTTGSSNKVIYTRYVP